jgi:hypothetical protein
MIGPGLYHGSEICSIDDFELSISVNYFTSDVLFFSFGDVVRVAMQITVSLRRQPIKLFTHNSCLGLLENKATSIVMIGLRTGSE